MLTVTDEAATLIRRLLARSALPDTAGLRLATDPQRHCLAMSLVPRPGNRDVVVAAGGTWLSVAPDAALRLSQRTLQAQLADRPAFYLT